jgi:hypothetical protein
MLFSVTITYLTKLTRSRAQRSQINLSFCAQHEHQNITEKKLANKTRFCMVLPALILNQRRIKKLSAIVNIQQFFYDRSTLSRNFAHNL